MLGSDQKQGVASQLHVLIELMVLANSQKSVGSQLQIVKELCKLQA
jgi:hypothetical protein